MVAVEQHVVAALQPPVPDPTGDGDELGGQAATLKQLWALTYREAQVQTFADAFPIIFACFVVTTAMVPSLMRKAVAPEVPPAEAH